MEGRALPEAIENALRALFCEKNGFNKGVNGRGLGRFSFHPKTPERLLPDSTMTYRDRSDGLVVESDRKKILHLNVRVIHATYKDIAFIHKEFFFFSFSPRQCVAPIALMDEPPLERREPRSEERRGGREWN